MIIVQGDSPYVTSIRWNGKRVWTTGLYTGWDVIKTYADVCVLVVSKMEHLMNDIKGFYVINEGDRHVAEEAVLRGAYCLNCPRLEGLRQLTPMIRNYK